MRQNKTYIVQIDGETPIEVPEGTVFTGCELRFNEINVNTCEPAEVNEMHEVILTAFGEYNSYDDNAVHIGFCSNIVHGGDETFHVIAQSETMLILTHRPQETPNLEKA